ncbi:MAG TPA: RagB/SusD family nutrient uptake outer membrane protein [Candidatus Sphingobacterium stercoripullorum]|uniref:RagB/SusD family nutrient uptake outer membrane protein n=1 Tax=Candidatus Sphingobacterium stercoripullorum TaxID=2838759 RepID=A0A9D2AYX5_9SPHI|nr:RagB/SusD family nutrient uptake outer membrane protein [Candidatus Sphingobacterium stercoripullorum]
MRIFKNTFALLVITAFIGCTKYLEVNPDNRVRLTTVDDFKAVVTGAYPQAYHHFTELYTDNVRYYDYPSYNNANITSWLFPIYLWSDNYIVNNAITPEAAWRKYYKNIYEANVVLEGIDGATGDERLKQSIKGEALMIRAYCHFMLVNIFAKHYDPITSESDLGIPYVVEPEKEPGQHYKRDAVKYVYDQIEKDAQEALELIREEYMEVPKYHWSRASIHAFFSRFYLFKEDWERSLYHSQEVLKLNNSVRNLFDDFDMYFQTGDYNGFANRYFETHQSNVLLVNYTLTWNTFERGSLYANEFRNTFHANDVRGRIYTTWSSQTPNYMARKFRRNLPADGQSYADVGLFVVEEVMYNAAEASVRKNDPDFGYAIDMLNTILKERWRPYVPLNVSDYSTKEELLEKVIDEKNKELCYEGYRWFDIKRHEIEVEHWDGNKYDLLKVDDPRRIVQIPFSELEANPDMVPNPR